MSNKIVIRRYHIWNGEVGYDAVPHKRGAWVKWDDISDMILVTNDYMRLLKSFSPTKEELSLIKNSDLSEKLKKLKTELEKWNL